MRDVRFAETCLEIGVIGEDVRNLWAHIDCADPKLAMWNIQPTIQKCMKCQKPLGKNDLVQPVFRVLQPKAVNPSDPTDVGLIVGDRVYFVHASCENVQLNSPLIYTP